MKKIKITALFITILYFIFLMGKVYSCYSINIHSGLGYGILPDQTVRQFDIATCSTNFFVWSFPFSFLYFFSTTGPSLVTLILLILANSVLLYFIADYFIRRFEQHETDQFKSRTNFWSFSKDNIIKAILWAILLLAIACFAFYVLFLHSLS